MKDLKAIAPGFGIALVTAIVSYLSASLHPSFDALVISIVFGMLLANGIGDRETYEKGVEAAIKVFLPIGIALYGTQLAIAGVDLRLLPAIVIAIGLIFGVTYFISRGFGMGRGLSVLLGTGLAVCGASAIAVMSPLINSRKEETSISLISVMTLGLTAMLLFSFIPEMLGLSVSKFAFLTGMTLPMFGQVKVAASTLGKESLSIASNYKLLRVSSLLFFACIAILTMRKKGGMARIPWFMVAFFVLAVSVNLFEGASALREYAAPVSKFSLTTALAAIGLSIDFDSITEEGAKPLFSVFLSWGIVALMLYVFVGAVNV